MRAALAIISFLLAFIAFSPIAFAGPYGLNVWHPAGTITDGTFPGNYTFNGTVNITPTGVAGTAFYMNSSGGIGIGKPNPNNSILDIAGSNNQIRVSYSDTIYGAIGTDYHNFWMAASDDVIDLVSGSSPDSITLRLGYSPGAGTSYGRIVGNSGGGLQIDSANGASTFFNGITLSNTGRVGINITSPLTILDVRGNQDSVTRLNLLNSNDTGTSAQTEVLVGQSWSNQYGRLQYFNSNYGSSGAYMANATVIDAEGPAGLNLVAGQSTGVIRFYAGGTTDSNESMRITETRKVGIGTTTPQQTLTVAGTLNVTGFLTTNRMFNNTIIVAKNGGDFSTITAALASITDNNASNLYVIRVMPGIYSEGNITMKQYVDIVGSGWYATKITQADNNITIAGSIQNATIADLTLELTGPTGPNTAAIRIDSASITVDHVRFIISGGSSGPDVVTLKNSGNSLITNSYFRSYNSGSAGGRMVVGEYGFSGIATVSNNIMEGCYTGIHLHDGGIINSSYNIISCSDSDFWLNNAGSTINSYKDTYSRPVHNEGGTFNKKDYWIDPQGVTAWSILPLGARAFVNGSSSGTYIGINAPATFGGNYIDFKRDGVGTSDFVVNGTGAVGIGTTAPGYLLDVNGSVRFSSTGTLFADGGIRGALVAQAGEYVGVEDNIRLYFGTDEDYAMGYHSTSDTLQFVDGGTIGTNVRMVIDNQGNVGIGTTAPGAKLAVNGDITSKPDSYTKLLLHMDGIDGSTTFTDETGKTVTVNGSAQIDTAQSKFGGASGLFNGTTDYLSLADSDDWNFGSGNFTIDFWVRPNALPAINDYFYDQFADGGGNNRTLFAFVGSGKSLSFLSVINGVTKADYNTTTAVNWVLGKWYHIAVVRNGTNLYIFQDGVSQALTVNTAIGTNDLGDVLGNLTIGVNDGNPIGDRYFNGWIDEYRVSKGIARWTTNFTPPNAPHGGMDGIGLSGIVSSQWTSTGSNIFYNSGNVGIGTTSPLNKTHIYNGTMLIEYGANTENTYSMIQLDKIDQISSKYLRLGIGGSGYREGVISGAQGLQLNSDGDNANYYISFSTAGTERVRIDNTGNLGINTTSPTGLFQVNGNATQTSFIVKHDFARGRATVGIGTDNPNRVGHEGSVLTLVANSSYSGTQNNAIEFVVDGKDSGSGGFIEWLAAGNRYAILSASKQGEANDTGYMKFQTMNAGVGAERMRITETGFIGINTTTPAGILHVATNGVNALVVQNGTGYVGIGTTRPQNALDVAGTGNFTSNILVGGTAIASKFQTTSGVASPNTNTNIVLTGANDGTVNFYLLTTQLRENNQYYAFRTVAKQANGNLEVSSAITGASNYHSVSVVNNNELNITNSGSYNLDWTLVRIN